MNQGADNFEAACASLLGDVMSRFRLSIRWLIPFGAGMCGLVFSANAQPREWKAPAVEVHDGMLRVDVNDVAPLARVLAELESLCVCPITYEVPPFEHPDDLVELSPPGARGGPRLLIPKPGAFKFSHTLRASSVRDDIEDAVREAIRAYEKQGLPGQFKVEREGTMLHVAPTSVRTKAGGVREVNSILDAEISLPAREWAAMDGIRAVLDAVQEVSGVSIRLTVQPINLLIRHRVLIEANGEPAHTVLARLLATSSTPMSWGVGYNILSQEYTMGIHVVRPR